MDNQKSPDDQSARARATTFCRQYGQRIPILQAPMAGSSPVDLAIAVAEAGGMGAMGALLSSPETISDWGAQFRSRSNGPFQLNLWIPDPAVPLRDFDAEQQMREFLASWGRRYRPSLMEFAFLILRSSATLFSRSNLPWFLQSWVCILRHL
jgi:NAD(P)H-dependent flavin oxidoreductase YrpB (nitropropane dioxygenase family)